MELTMWGNSTTYIQERGILLVRLVGLTKKYALKKPLDKRTYYAIMWWLGMSQQKYACVHLRWF